MTWPMATLDDLKSEEPRSITDGPFGSHLASRHYTAHGPRVVRLQNIGDGRFEDARAHISDEHFLSLRAHEVRPGDLLVASLGEVLPRACIAPTWLGPAIVKADCIRVRLGDRVDPRWVLYALQRPDVRRWADEHRHGVGRPRLGLKTIREIPIPLPPLEEQLDIVGLLEQHLSRLEAADSDLQSIGVKQEALWLSGLSAIRRSLTDAGTSQIGDIASTSLGKMLDAKKQTGRLTPYLRNINVRWGSFELRDVQLTPLTEGDIERFDVRHGDVMVCEGGEPGRCAVWRESAEGIAFQKALHRIRIADQDVVLPDFLCLMLTESIRSGRSDRLFTGTTIRHLPQENLRMIELPVPLIADQLNAIAVAAGISAARVRLAIATDAGRRQTAVLRKALLAAAYSGRLTGSASDRRVADGWVAS